ncbi:prealbumin-like fold domain-containing protein [Photobacterium atrarenae]|uniref:SpaA-like prealbumin fold domain-containing protein n=1 Tax=Photobacterium atrarenae TaxID=865757 RepID=A0ABY5GE78_9GAMM|nr:hypothetical protein [Photobacterium atrarenae]UTV27419.1 hypothetical protein NNL38_14015 [Photobacterium atrarenae]
MKPDVILRGIKYALGVSLLSSTAMSTAWAFDPPPNTVQFRLEGCRNDGNPTLIAGSNTLPNTDDNFTCQDPAPLGGNDTPYTTGNLGKGWHELDLVPHRLTTTNGNSSGNVTYDVIIAADHALASGIEGYDQIFDVQIIKAPDTLNVFSDTSCSLVVGAQQIDASGTVTGGIEEVIYRQLTITQGPDTTCVIDWANRLAIGASQFSGSSLQAYMFEAENFQTGKRTVPIPVKDIEAAAARKDMSATEGGGLVWNVTKQASPAQVDLGNTCDVSETNTQDVTIRVDWEVRPTEAGTVAVVTNIYTTNPASRDILVDVTDTLTGNGTPAVNDVATAEDVPVPAGSETLVLTHLFDAPADASDLSDTAVLTFIDPATNEPFAETIEVTFDLPNSDIQPGSQTETTATISDTEQIVGDGLSYAVASIAGGSASGTFSDSYSLGTFLTESDPNLVWTSEEQPSGTCEDDNGCPVGFVEFTKTIAAAAVTTTNGTLSDWALLTAANGATASSGDANSPVSILVTAAALVDLDVELTIPAAQDLTCNVEVKDSGNNVVQNLEFEFDALGATTLTETAEDIEPDSYTATVTSCGNLVGTTVKTIDMTLPAQPTLADCTDTLSFTLEAPEPDDPVLAAVNKVTLPAGFESGWEMTLQGPGLPPGGITLSTDGDPATFEVFQLNNSNFELLDGDYTITETPQQGWAQTSSSGCSFTVDTAADAGQTKQCVITNQKLGKIVVKKLTEPKYGTGFSFTHDIGSNGTPFSLDHGQMEMFIDVLPGTYTVTEDDPSPAFQLTGLTCTESEVENSTPNQATRSVEIELDPGETVECTFTNRESGMVKVIKKTNGYITDDVWHFTLTGPGLNTAAQTPPAHFDFDGAKLIPGEVYTLCETDIPHGWHPVWLMDFNKDGYPETLLDELEGATDAPVDPYTGISLVYKPNGETQYGGYGSYGSYGSSPEPETYCVNFTVKPGQTLKMVIDNMQYLDSYDPKPKACYDKPINDRYVTHEMVDGKGYRVGYYPVDSCDKLSGLLDYDSSKGSADDLATKLMHATLSRDLGYRTCDQSDRVMKRAQRMLEQGGYSHLGYHPGSWDSYTAGKLATKLNRYSQHRLCD